MRTRWVVMAVASVLLVVQGRAMAQEQEVEEKVDLMPHAGQFEVGLFAGGFFPSDSHELYDWETAEWTELDPVGPELGLRLGFYPLAFLGVEGEADLLPFGTDRGESALLYGARAQIVAQLPARVTPFVLAGFGMMGVTSDADSLGDDTDKVGHLGAGARFQVSRRVSVRLDGRYLRAPQHDDADHAGEGTNHFAVLVGATLTLGGAAPAEPEVVAPADGDHDGVVDADDSCPGKAGLPPDGCPPVDSDRDGLNDDVDKCPREEETTNGFEDDDGCPDKIPDRDGDGISDALDTCVDQPEDVDGFEDTDGCPDPDNDADGVVDGSDRCPSEVGPIENSGCPDTDRDSDGVVDRLDNCPEEAGTEANHGCKKKQLVVLTQNQLKILDKVYFKTGKSIIDKRSNRLLDNVVLVMTNHPEIQRIRIEGHTDDKGDDAYNKDLSQRRASAVMDYLMVKGVPADRLEAVGYGEEKPIASNDKESGRAQNRRVEFNIVSGQSSAPAPERSGDDTVKPAGGGETIPPP